MNAPNVVFITIDSLRADHTACLDYRRAVDPRLRELCERGTKFQQAVANGPNTTASFPSILTGAHSLTYGPYGVCGEGSPFFARALKRAGYQTVGYHSNPYLGAEQNYPTGFDIFNDAVEGDKPVAILKETADSLLPTDSRLYRLLRRGWHYFSMNTDNAAYARAETISNNLIDLVENDNQTDKPFFAWLHYMDAHYPFQPPSDVVAELTGSPLSTRRVVNLNGKMHERPSEMTDEDIEDLIALYDAEIRYTDSQIGRVLDTLEECDILDDTIVVITADHGEAFGEHDKFGHHPYPHEELVRVPLVIAGPGIDATTVDQQVSLIDLAPTLLDLLGVTVPDTMEGRSFSPVLHGNPIDDRTSMTISDGGTVYGIRTDRWKYITRVDETETYLYDLGTDPAETDEIHVDHPEVTDRFESIISTYRKRIDTGEQATVDYDPEIEQRLADLGYK